MLVPIFSRHDSAVSPSQPATENKPVYQLIAEDNARQAAAPSVAAPKPTLTTPAERPTLKAPGVHFEEFKVAPTRRLISHPKFGKIIEVTYEGGRKLFEFPDPTYDVSTGELVQQPEALR